MTVTELPSTTVYGPPASTVGGAFGVEPDDDRVVVRDAELVGRVQA